MIFKHVFLGVAALLSGLATAVDHAVACAEEAKIQPRDHDELDYTTIVTQTQQTTGTYTLTVEDTPTCATETVTVPPITGPDDGGIVATTSTSTSWSTFETTDTLTLTSTITSGTSTLTTTVTGNGSSYTIPPLSTSPSWSTSTTSAGGSDDAGQPATGTSVTPFVTPSSAPTADDGATDTSISTHTSTETLTETPTSTDSSEPTVSAAAMPMILSNDLLVAMVAAAMVIAA